MKEYFLYNYGDISFYENKDDMLEQLKDILEEETMNANHNDGIWDDDILHNIKAGEITHLFKEIQFDNNKTFIIEEV